MAKVLINETSLSGIAEAIRAKNGSSETYKPSEMAAAIEAIEAGGGGLPEEALVISGDCSSRFAQNGWNWYVEGYGDQITTKDITNLEKMFYQSNKLEEIPFDINCLDNVANKQLGYMFYRCTELKHVPKINTCMVAGTPYMFYECKSLRQLPEDIDDGLNWSWMDGLSFDTSKAENGRQYMFYNCHSLRSIPMEFLNHAISKSSYTNSIYYNGFYFCATLDEIVDLPIPYIQTWTSNAFGSTFSGCMRVKNITFATPNGAPYVVNWKNQSINLRNQGWNSNPLYILNFNSGITADKEVKDDATYQALKNNPDWYATKAEYSRYNHDSAVATINSLPDASAYLAANGGTNTISFTGAEGSATDGGAINTLTEEEIAVAAAKGWTVTIS